MSLRQVGCLALVVLGLAGFLLLAYWEFRTPTYMEGYRYGVSRNPSGGMVDAANEVCADLASMDKHWDLTRARHWIDGCTDAHEGRPARP
ncbi:hypothetical protein OHT93_13275 [Streptomyces sp. NBC_00191]|uniref:hypothetical protein n=1 Tax=Streptomyces sp. NBC_00191 TaxID=2975674 RepID=UPI00324FE2BC